MLGGQISFGQATREAFRRGREKIKARRERAMLDELASQPLSLHPEFQRLSPPELLDHFRKRSAPVFLPGFQNANETAAKLRDLLAGESERLIQSARLIVKSHRWPLLGFGEQEFGESINWRRDPLSGRVWPLDYHRDILLWHNDGSDIRVLWELNRLSHLITLGQASALTSDEEFAREFFAQLESWREQNPVGRGPNWSCAMEVALRAMNLLAAFSCFRRSSHLTEERLLGLLTLFEQHAAHIRRNLEFSYVATSNHYLSDVAGLLWLGIMLPELRAADEWREWALAEMLREMDKQILPDGADHEGSTGYHCFVLELFLYSFLLCRVNKIEIEDKYWRKLHKMLEYLRRIVRPDGLTPLIGDTDGGHTSSSSRNANDHSYLLDVGAAVLADEQLKVNGSATPPELIWLLGENELQTFQQLAAGSGEQTSQAFPDAGTYVLRHEDLFLAFNANGATPGRPASHRHNDLLSIEVSAHGRPFIVDPGTYVYTANLRERHLFRSTAYHSTITIDREEQQTIREETPFAIGNEARVRVSLWKTTPEFDQVVAEHSAYERLASAVIHRRTIKFYKSARWWLIEDEIAGKGEHEIAARFHFDAGLELETLKRGGVIARDVASGNRLCIQPIEVGDLSQPEFESQFVSRHYGSKLPSMTAKWTTKRTGQWKISWAIVPVAAGEDIEERLDIVSSF